MLLGHCRLVVCMCTACQRGQWLRSIWKPTHSLWRRGYGICPMQKYKSAIKQLKIKWMLYYCCILRTALLFLFFMTAVFCGFSMELEHVCMCIGKKMHFNSLRTLVPTTFPTLRCCLQMFVGTIQETPTCWTMMVMMVTCDHNWLIMLLRNTHQSSSQLTPY